jgi:hypothetical protein
MATEIKVWGEGRLDLWSQGERVSIPGDFEEIKPGDAYVTRHVKLRSDVVYCRMKKSKRQRFSKLVGILAPSVIVEEVLADAEQTKRQRSARNAAAALYRSRKEEEFNQQRVALLKEMLPSIPEEDAEDIVERAFEVGSGRVGRTSALSDQDKLHAATIAHIRHCRTDYESLLGDGIEREEARERVADTIQRIYSEWESECTAIETGEETPPLKHESVQSLFSEISENL